MKIISDSLHTRVLGANLQHNMLWQAHLETGPKALLPSIRKQLGKLKHLGKLLPMGVRPNLAKGLLLSRFSYLLPLWGGASNAYLKRAQVVLNSVARWSTGKSKRTKINKRAGENCHTGIHLETDSPKGTTKTLHKI